MQYQDSVANIRKNLATLRMDPVVYCWWFQDVSPVVKYVITHPDIDGSKLITKTINGKTYYALYVGIGKECKERFKWHIAQPHSSSSVRSGFLSTLRQTLSALLGKDMTLSKNDVDAFMDAYCFLEWDLYPNNLKQQLEVIENSIINGKNGYYPLNIQKNRHVSKSFTQSLKALRKQHKK